MSVPATKNDLESSMHVFRARLSIRAMNYDASARHESHPKTGERPLSPKWMGIKFRGERNGGLFCLCIFGTLHGCFVIKKLKTVALSSHCLCPSPRYNSKLKTFLPNRNKQTRKQTADWNSKGTAHVWRVFLTTRALLLTMQVKEGGKKVTLTRCARSCICKQVPVMGLHELIQTREFKRISVKDGWWRRFKILLTTILSHC